MTDLYDTDRGASGSAAQDLKRKAADLGQDVRQRAGDALTASTGVAREKLSEFTEAAKDVASHAAGKVTEQVGAQQSAGADFVERFAGNLRNSAKAFEDTPFAAKGIDLAADYVGDAANMIRNGSARDLVDGATSFARRQPAAFLGLSVLAGFAAVRFLKAGNSGSGMSSGMSKDTASNQRAGASRSSAHVAGE